MCFKMGFFKFLLLYGMLNLLTLPAGHLLYQHYQHPQEIETVKNRVANWCSVNVAWVHSLLAPLMDPECHCGQLVTLRCPVFNYVTGLLSPNSTVDEAGLLIISHVYKLKLGVIIDNAFWSSWKDDAVHSCDYYLALRGTNFYSLVSVKEVARVRKLVKHRKATTDSNLCGQKPSDVVQETQRTIKSEEDLRKMIYEFARHLND